MRRFELTSTPTFALPISCHHQPTFVFPTQTFSSSFLFRPFANSCIPTSTLFDQPTSNPFPHNLEMSHHPQLSVSTGSAGAGPSTPTLPRRPQGARRRGVMPGLFIANPDNSDEENSPPKAGSQRSSSGVSPISVSSSSGRGGPSSVSIPQPASPSHSIKERGSLPYPSIPAPQSSPLPSISAFPSPQPLIPTPSPAPIAYGHTPEISSGPPQPPPQPQRHLQRAFTTATPENAPRLLPEPRSSSTGTTSFHQQVNNSPSRALPSLPSPITRQSTMPSPVSQSPSTSHGQPYSAPPAYHPHDPTRVASPDDVMSPATGSEQGSIMSAGIGHRNRSASVQGQQVRLQVTTDNEAFHLVDITGINTAEGIREKVFSKVSTVYTR